MTDFVPRLFIESHYVVYVSETLLLCSIFELFFFVIDLWVIPLPVAFVPFVVLYSISFCIVVKTFVTVIFVTF